MSKLYFVFLSLILISCASHKPKENSRVPAGGKETRKFEIGDVMGVVSLNAFMRDMRCQDIENNF
jgi:hypothetical protein